MTLDYEIELAQRQVRTDALSMSIGEIVNMYEANELVIRPPFQRLFRWDVQHKSKLVESVYLGIPIPPIFVFETENGQWELIDGLQRISTILEFMGVLREEDTQRLNPPSFLEGTRYMPSLKNTVWEKSDSVQDLSVEEQNELSKPQQFFFKRAKINVQILKRPSDAHTKYDLFQRLNRGGTQANAQEVRNCVVIMVNKDFFDIINRLVNLPSFQAVSRVTEQGEKTQRPLEIIMRFFVLYYYEYTGELDVEEFVDDRIIALAETRPSESEIVDLFAGTFDLLHEAFGVDALRRYVPTTGNFQGRVGQVAIEVVSVGIAKNLKHINTMPDRISFIQERIRNFWSQPEADEFSASGLRGTQRLKRTVNFGVSWFSP